MRKKYTDMLTCEYDGYAPHFVGYGKLGHVFAQENGLEIESDFEITEEVLNYLREDYDTLDEYYNKIDIYNEYIKGVKETSIRLHYVLENMLEDRRDFVVEFDDEFTINNRKITNVTTYKTEGCSDIFL